MEMMGSRRSPSPLKTKMDSQGMSPLSNGNGGSSDGGAGNESGRKGSSMSTRVRVLLPIVLCLQHSMFRMLRIYSVINLEEKWSFASVLLVGEIIKLAVSTVMTLADKTPSPAGTGLSKLCWLVRASPPMVLPAVIFWIMNLLSYVSMETLDASTFTLFAQTKILTTAGFSVVLTKTTLSAQKWRALFLLFFSVVLVSNGYIPLGAKGGRGINQEFVAGLVAVVTEAILSGFVTVFFEKILKSKVINLTIWDRNFQLAIFSIIFYLPLALGENQTLLGGWTLHATLLAVLVAGGGLLVAFILKYTNAIVKTLGVSSSVIFTAIFGHVLLGFPLDVPIGIGVACAILALFNFSDNKYAPLAAGQTAAEEAAVSTKEGQDVHQSLLSRGNPGVSEYAHVVASSQDSRGGHAV